MKNWYTCEYIDSLPGKLLECKLHTSADATWLTEIWDVSATVRYFVRSVLFFQDPAWNVKPSVSHNVFKFLLLSLEGEPKQICLGVLCCLDLGSICTCPKVLPRLRPRASSEG